MNGVSLFANVGIAETYIKNYGINMVVANELLTQRANFYSYLYPETKIINGDITNPDIFDAVLKIAKDNKCQFLLATPPCQGMSIAGKKNEDDPRNSLIMYVIKFIQELQPTNVIIENVQGILKTSININNKKIKITDYIFEQLTPLGYFINPKVLDCADYDTPQTRKRAIYLISKIKIWEPPLPKQKITVKEAIGHLPPLESGESSDIPYHYAKARKTNHILCLKHTPTGKSALHNTIYFPKKSDGSKIKGYSTTYKRIEWDKPAPTITMANGSISSQNNVHPGRIKSDGTYSDSRVLSLKEIFILTGLPDDWTPPKWASENIIRQVIGEGVPPKLIANLLSTMPR